MIQGIIKCTWLGLSIFILFFCMYRLMELDDNYIIELIGYMSLGMFVISFPCGFVPMILWFLISVILESFSPMFRGFMFSRYIDLFFVWGTFWLAGFFQWFYLFPKIIRAAGQGGNVV
ncbi:hypothetical protein JG320_003539 [Salmonella enterica subsp. enterica serovar Stanleyville]|uniref:hypothetical protein n=1 Tax=Salmonella enterica TaxID=28901 RepID=UPI0012C141EC|nr:hypothetical protein [Salmonella enterica]ECG3772157.1 hypothetical protein [Salmonella enterica subsp. enterica serovar Stanleyville]EDH9977274.1 hypothetical protein [Salmonella enterica subsp. enterica serovar Wangata]EHG3458981.1 hypothetical protein [Salmonella enterica subsp. enterica serovar Moero]EIZ4039704.1 hypothetical protein [Salmonella enterica subsp. enterica serovar Canada]EFT9514781.1 hypothetical protein [Salmonella enterica subsp. enterica serovar Wangata]